MRKLIENICHQFILIHHPHTAVVAFAAIIMGASLVAINPSPKQVNAACASSSYGSATQSVTIRTTATYRLWARIQGPSSTTNSFNLEIDGGTCYSVGGSNLTANTWTWVDYQNGNSGSKINLMLNAGNHSLKYVGTKSGLLVDKVMFVSDAACPPSGDGSNCTSITSTPPPTAAPTINSFTATPTSITVGNKSTLSWSTSNTANCSISPSGAQNTTLKSWTTPTLTTAGSITYTLSCQNSAGQRVTKTTSVTVSAAASAPSKPTFLSSDSSVAMGGSIVLSWTSTNATACTLTPGNISSKGTASMVVTNIRATTTYNLSCSNNVGSSQASPITVTVSANGTPTTTTAPVIVSFTADPASTTSGGASTLSWLVSGASVSGCRLVTSPLSATGGGGSWRTPTLTQSTSYTLTCINESGKSVSRSVGITVDGKPAPAAPAAAAPSTSGADTQTSLTASTGVKVSNGGSTSLVSGLTALDPSNITDPSKEKTISRVEYYQDDKLIQTVDVPPFALDTTKLVNGQYTITERTYFQDGSQSDITKVVQIANSLPNTGGLGGSGKAGVIISIVVVMAAAGVVGFFFLRRKLTASTAAVATEQPYDFFADPHMYPQANQQNQEFKNPYDVPGNNPQDWKK